MTTSKKVASLAGKQLKSKNTSKSQKEVDGSALSQADKEKKKKS